MAHSKDLFECSVCTQLLNDPVTTTCGHSFCVKCIYTHWDTKRSRRRTYSCPLCRETFNERPVLKRSTILANLVEEYKKKASGQGAAADAAAPGDAQCDICMERKRKACMFCQVCLASYCQTHLEPHFIVPPLKKHRLITASINIKESICCRHDKLQEIYCLTNQQFVCRMCALDEHKDHDIHKGQIPPAVFRKVGVHLNYEEGTLAFYSVSCIESLTLLHQIQTTFTEPLYPRFSVDLGATLRISNIRDSAQFPMLMY